MGHEMSGIGPNGAYTRRSPITVTAEPDERYRADPDVAWLTDAVFSWRSKTERPRSDPGKFHPSDLALSDDEIIARYLGTTVTRDDDIDARKLMIFDNGHSVHRRWGRYLRKAGVTVPKHPKHFYIPRLKLRGTCDEIVARPETGEVTIVELKSINPFGFSALKSGQESHVAQLHCYMAGLRILNGILLYECKGSQQVKVFAVPFDQERWRGIETRLLRLRKEAESRPQWSDRQKPEVVEAATALKNLLLSSDADDGSEVSDLREHPTILRLQRAPTENAIER